jgi:hypothetical protein
MRRINEISFTVVARARARARVKAEQSFILLVFFTILMKLERIIVSYYLNHKSLGGRGGRLERE